MDWGALLFPLLFTYHCHMLARRVARWGVGHRGVQSECCLVMVVVVKDNPGGGRLLVRRLRLPWAVSILLWLLLGKCVLGRQGTSTQRGNDELVGAAAIIGYADDNEYPFPFNLCIGEKRQRNVKCVMPVLCDFDISSCLTAPSLALCSSSKSKTRALDCMRMSVIVTPAFPIKRPACGEV